jgi:hypothetical protein
LHGTLYVSPPMTTAADTSQRIKQIPLTAFRIDAKQQAQLKRTAAARGVTVSELIRQSLRLNGAIGKRGS